MSYALKYFWTYELPEQSIRLEIYKKDSLAAPMEIGNVVQGLQLTISGGEDNIDAPMLSTSLVMTFADAYDHPDSESLKCGNWAEFYTPDATLWKVILLGKSSAESSFREIWGGYVTPDSYEEELSYGGSVTIVARDNIGHLNDFTFDAKGDAEGMISFRELVEAAWAKIESPMSLIWGDTWLQTEGVDAPDTYLYAPAFEGDSWYKAVEDVLFSYGAVMRYCGSSKVMICPLAYLPYSGEDQDKTLNPTFVAGATRLLTPAVKRIEESVEYDVSTILAKLVKAEDFDGTSIEVPDSSGFTGTANPLKAKEKGTGWINPTSESAIYFSPASYDTIDENVAFTDEEKANLPSSMMLLCNSKNGAAIYSRYVNACDNLQYELRFGGRYYKAGATKLGKFNQDYCKIDKFVYSLRYTESGVTEYLQSNGEWDAAAATLEISADNNSLSSVSIPVSLSFNKKGLLELIIKRIEIRETLNHGYVVVEALVLSVNENTAYLKKNSVNTIYDDKNNVILQREPRFAPTFNAVAFAGLIKNGIYAKVGEQFRPTPKWAWPGSSAQQMSVYIHLQQICYYAKPNNILEGTIVNGDVTSFGEVWQWENKKHLFVAGQFNFLTGHIDSAILREYLTYEEMWSNVPETQLPSVDSASMNTIENEASSGSSNANTYSNTTTVNIGQGGGGSGASYLNDLLDVNTQDIISGSILYFNGSEWVDRSLAVWLEDLLEKSTYLASLWKIDPLTGEMYTEKKVRVKNDMYADGEVSAGGIGEEGEGDTDLTEVFNRLEIAEADIAEIQSVLDNIGKIGTFLPLTGGTLEGQLTISTNGWNNQLILNGIDSNSGIQFKYSGALMGALFSAQNELYWMNESAYKLIHEGNVGSQKVRGLATIATYTGQLITYDHHEGLLFENSIPNTDLPWASGYNNAIISLSRFHDVDGYDTQLGFGANGMYYRAFVGQAPTKEAEWKTFAFTDSIVFGAERLTETISNESINLWQNDGVQMISVTAEGFEALGAPKRWVSGLSVLTSYVGWQLVCGASRWNSTDFFIRKRTDENTFTEWKTLAFLDSNVASAQALKHSNETLGAEVDGNGDISLENGIYWHNEPNAYYIKSPLAEYGALLEYNAYAGHRFIGGNVGIGKNPSEYKLDVDGDTAVRGLLWLNGKIYQSGYWILGIHPDNNLYLGYETKAIGNTLLFGKQLEFYNSIGSNTMLIKDNGYVGIGRSNPSYKLDVNGQIRSVIEDKFGIIIEKASGGWDGGGISFWYGDWHRGSIDASILTLNPYTKGKVGVGISNPEALLDVNGDARVRGCLSFSGITALNTPIIKFAGGEYFDIYGNLVFAKNSGSWSIFDQSTDNTLFRIYRASGNVGIGNADPAYKLDVNGAIHSQTGYYVGSSLFAWYDNGTWVRDANTLNLNSGTALKMYINYAEKFALTDTLFDIKTNAKVGGSLTMTNTIFLANDKGIYAFAKDNSNSYHLASLGGDDIFRYGYGAKDLHIRGNSITLMYGANHTSGLVLNSSGNVSINKNLNLGGTAYINGEIFLGNDAEGIFYYKGIPRLCYHNQGTWVSNLMTFEHNRVTIHQHLSLANALYVDTSGNGFMMAGTDYYSYIARTEDGQWKEDIFSFYPNGDNYAFGKFIFAQLIRAEQGIKIGDATITWDAEANALKIDGNVYATGEVAAGGIAN